MTKKINSQVNPVQISNLLNYCFRLLSLGTFYYKAKVNWSTELLIFHLNHCPHLSSIIQYPTKCTFHFLALSKVGFSVRIMILSLKPFDLDILFSHTICMPATEECHPHIRMHPPLISMSSISSTHYYFSSLISSIYNRVTRDFETSKTIFLSNLTWETLNGIRKTCLITST